MDPDAGFVRGPEFARAFLKFNSTTSFAACGEPSHSRCYAPVGLRSDCLANYPARC